MRRSHRGKQLEPPLKRLCSPGKPAMAFVLILVKLFPQIISLSVWWFVAFVVICALRPLYVMYLKDDEPGRP